MISVCIITKNERDNLKTCLDILSGYDAEIVVVDTGSEDDSIEVSRTFTESVYSFAWCDDFAAARNYAAGVAKNDRILMLDTDEWILHMDLKELEAMFEENEKVIGRIIRLSDFEERGNKLTSKEIINRVYDRRFYHYEGKVHEQLVGESEEMIRYEKTSVKVRHVGYEQSPEQKKRKTDRNLKLLFQELEETPTDTYILYQIGKSFYYIEDYQRAAEFFQKALETDWSPKYEYVLDLLTCYGYALINTGNVNDALGLEQYWKYYPNQADYTYMMGYIYMNHYEFEKAIETFLQATECTEYLIEGVNSYLAYHNAGVIFQCTGHEEEANEMYEKSRQLREAVNQ